MSYISLFLIYFNIFYCILLSISVCQERRLCVGLIRDMFSYLPNGVKGLELYRPGTYSFNRVTFGLRGERKLLFKPEHIGLIHSGRKTQTRRLWKKPRAKVGVVHKAKTALFSQDYFALIKITALRLRSSRTSGSA